MHCSLPIEGGSTLQQEHHSDNLQAGGLGSTPSLPEHQGCRSRQARPYMGKTIQDYQGGRTRGLQALSLRWPRHSQQMERNPPQVISFLGFKI